MDDLYFINIKIQPTYINSIVCKDWYNKTKDSLKNKKIEFFDLQLYNLLNNKCACYIRYKYTYDIDGLIDRVNIDDGNNKLFINAYNNLIHSLMEKIIKDLDIKMIIRSKIIDKYRKMMGLYKKYKLFVYNFTDRDIAEEYKMILIKYYEYNYSMFAYQPISSSVKKKLYFEEENSIA